MQRVRTDRVVSLCHGLRAYVPTNNIAVPAGTLLAQLCMSLEALLPG